jgi:dCTP deaminase
MILSDTDILASINSGDIICHPFDRSNVSNSSIDLRLGRYIVKQNRKFNPIKFSADSSGKLTVLNPAKTKIYDLLGGDPDDYLYVIRPGEFVLAQTLEFVGNPGVDLVSEVMDKSTLARLGLSVCFSAGFIDAGNALNITLELKNNGNNAIELQYGQHVCQLRFHRLSSPVSSKYSGKYYKSLITEGAK